MESISLYGLYIRYLFPDQEGPLILSVSLCTFAVLLGGNVLGEID